MQAIDTILFDLDGTLIDSRLHIIKSVKFMLEKLELPGRSDAEITGSIGWGVEDLLLCAIGQEKKELLPAAYKLFKDHYHHQFRHETKLQPHVTDILEHFSAKTKIIVTNASFDNATYSVSRLGIKKYFAGIVGGDDKLCLKPTACPIDKILDRIQKQKALMVGDMVVDIEAGKSAGILTCAVTNGIGRKADLAKAGPDFLIDDLLELKNIIV